MGSKTKKTTEDPFPWDWSTIPMFPNDSSPSLQVFHQHVFPRGKFSFLSCKIIMFLRRITIFAGSITIFPQENQHWFPYKNNKKSSLFSLVKSPYFPLLKTTRRSVRTSSATAAAASPKSPQSCSCKAKGQRPPCLRVYDRHW